MLNFDKLSRAVMRSALLWGAITSVAFYFALDRNVDSVNPLILRYLAGRWEAYACVAMFFVGMAALVIKAIDLGQGWYFYHRLKLDPATKGTANAANVPVLIRQLDAQSPFCQSTSLHRRLRDALEFVLRRGNQESLDGHLQHLADVDAARMNTSYGLPRFLCWAIPAVGSLGTVLGIALAIGQLSTPTPATPGTASLSGDVLSGVTAGLALAFDTMALALGLSIVLMLVRFACEQAECQLLDAVEARVPQELADRIGVASAAARNSQADQMRFLAQQLGELASKLDKLPFAAATSGTAGGVSSDQIESAISRAVAKAVTGQPQISMGGGGQLTDMSQVQDALKQIAQFFSIQQAEHQQESEIVHQLSEIIREGEHANWKPRKEKESMGGSLAGLWNALSD